MNYLGDVGFDTLLANARQGDMNAQKRVLILLASRNECCDKLSEFYDDIKKLTDDDTQWISPLALELFIPAVKVIRYAMHVVPMRSYIGEMIDEDTNEIVKAELSEQLDEKTILESDEDLLKKINQLIEEKIEILPTGSLYELFLDYSFFHYFISNNWCYNYDQNMKVIRELHDRDCKLVASTIGSFFRDGREDQGIFIDYKKAKSYFDLVNEDFNIDECIESLQKSRQDSQKKSALLTLEGSDVPAVKTFIDTLYDKLGKKDEKFMFIPLEVVMNELVCSPYYIGYVQEANEITPYKIQILVDCYSCECEVLKYALCKRFNLWNAYVEDIS